MLKRKKKTCSSCGQSTYLFSHNCCKYCYIKSRGAKFKPKLSEKAIEQIKADKEFYQMAWDSRPHYCQECQVYLGPNLNKGFVSHILPKGAYPEFRHHPKNWTLLCIPCHQVFEFGKRKEMKIWEYCYNIIEEIRNVK